MQNLDPPTHTESWQPETGCWRETHFQRGFQPERGDAALIVG
jgi:hypothetical protein